MEQKEIIQEKIINGELVRYNYNNDTIYTNEKCQLDTQYYVRTNSTNAYDTIIEITNACNQKCENCFLSCSPDIPPTEITVDTIKALLNERVDKRIRICISGGEPFLHSNIQEILNLSKDYPSLNFVLNSNGYRLLNKNEINSLSQFNWLLSFSIHGGRSTHNKYTHSKSFNHIIKNLKKINNKVRVHFYCVLHEKITLADINYLYELQKKFNIEFIRFIIPRPYGRVGSIAKKEILEYVKEKTYNNPFSGLKTEKSISEFISYKLEKRMSN